MSAALIEDGTALEVLPPLSPRLTRAIVAYRRATAALEICNAQLVRDVKENRPLNDEEFGRAVQLQQATDAARLEVQRTIDLDYLTRPLRAL